MAGAESLNLQAAGVVLFYDTPWSYGDLVQIIGRAQRIGSIQDHILLIHFANKGAIDLRVIERVTGKKELSSEVIGDTSKGALDFSTGEEGAVDELFQNLLDDGEV
jgi:SNF2 family DNA or RNA helicase